MASTTAQAEKDKGNHAFKAGEYASAIGFYSSAIVADRKDHTLPLNRAAAYLKLGKHEDAERDCATVLELNKNNVKALFRRGQARVGTGKLAEARSDYEAALKLEPSNDAVKQELAKLKSTPVSKPRTRPAEVMPSKPDVVHPRRRRIPITIVEPVASSSALPQVSPKPKEDLMKTVSSRSLSSITPPETLPLGGPVQGNEPESAPRATVVPPVARATAPPVIVKSQSPHPPPPAPTPRIRKVFTDEDGDGAASPKPPASSFASAKESRSASKPSRVGGGIFRTSGQHTVFGENKPAPIPSDPRNAKSYASPPKPQQKDEMEDDIAKWASAPRPHAASALSVAEKEPMTLFNFTRAWEAAKADHAARWALLSGIPPSTLPAMFQISLEPALLASILETLDAVQTPPESKEYLLALAGVPRFSTVTMFLSKKEKELARRVLESAGIVYFKGAGWAI